jgi:uncharacterized protein involved in response to NO
MPPIPRLKPYEGPALLSYGFRPFFLFGALYAGLAVLAWLPIFTGELAMASAFTPRDWHVHEMLYGYVPAVVTGFLLTAIPNWTGRLPLQGGPLIGLVLLWLIGRVAVLVSARIGGAGLAAVADLVFPAVFLAVIAREIVTGGNWRNLPMVGALALLLAGNCLIHAEALGWWASAAAGNRLGIATLLMLITLIGGRIVPSFTRNWLAKALPGAALPAPFDTFDRIVMALTALALVVWVVWPDGPVAAPIEIAAGVALAVRLARWRGGGTWREPLVLVLHLGYGWLALGFILLGVSDYIAWLPPTAALHALTAGAIGTMTLAVMTRASLGHTGSALIAGRGTVAIYALVTVAALLRLLAPLGGSAYLELLGLAGVAWAGAFGLFVVFYGPALMRPRAA